MESARDHFQRLAREYTPDRNYAQDILVLAEAVDAYGAGMDGPFCDAVLQFATEALPALVVPMHALQRMARVALEHTLAYLFIATKDASSFRALAPVLDAVADMFATHCYVSTDTAAVGLMVACADPPGFHAPLLSVALSHVVESSKSLADAMLLIEGFELPPLLVEVVRSGPHANAATALLLLGNLSCLYTVIQAAWVDTFRAGYDAMITLVQRASGQFVLTPTMVRDLFRYLGNVVYMLTPYRDGKAAAVTDAGVWRAAMALVPVAAAHVGDAGHEDTAQSALVFYKHVVCTMWIVGDNVPDVAEQLLPLARDAFEAHAASVSVTYEAILLCAELVFACPTVPVYARLAGHVYAGRETFPTSADVATAVVKFFRNAYSARVLPPEDFGRVCDVVRETLTRHMGSVRGVRECFAWLQHLVRTRNATALLFAHFVHPVLTKYAATEYDLAIDAFSVLAFVQRQFEAVEAARQIKAHFLPYAKHVLAVMSQWGYADDSAWAFMTSVHPHPGVAIPVAYVLNSFRHTYNWLSLLSYVMVAYVHDAPAMVAILNALASVVGNHCLPMVISSHQQSDACRFLEDVLARTHGMHRALIAKRFALTLAAVAVAASSTTATRERAARALTAVLPCVTSKLRLVSDLCMTCPYPYPELHAAIEAQRVVLDSRWSRVRSTWCYVVFRAQSKASIWL
jgi:hypothetical protein